MKTEAESREGIERLARSWGRPLAEKRALQDVSGLEPTRSVPVGTKIKPDPGGEIIIHVDSLRMHANRTLKQSEPIIRLIIGPTIIHAHSIKVLGEATLAEDYENPLHDRPSAVCVLKTKGEVQVLR